VSVDGFTIGTIEFSGRELRDLFVAWVALGAAFALFFGGGAGVLAVPAVFVVLFVINFLTAGVGFLLHELAHKVVAIRYGQVAEFRADYSMLVIAIATALAGFIFAAPGAVYHRGRITVRENGIIAVAGPVTNLLLAAAFAPLLFGSGIVYEVGRFGVGINLFLAAFNMIPFGPLDGKKVLAWSKSVFAVVFVGSALLAVGALLFLLF
jgi:Zn-dependent protease